MILAFSSSSSSGFSQFCGIFIVRYCQISVPSASDHPRIPQHEAGVAFPHAVLIHPVLRPSLTVTQHRGPYRYHDGSIASFPRLRINDRYQRYRRRISGLETRADEQLPHITYSPKYISVVSLIILMFCFVKAGKISSHLQNTMPLDLSF